MDGHVKFSDAISSIWLRWRSSFPAQQSCDLGVDLGEAGDTKPIDRAGSE